MFVAFIFSCVLIEYVFLKNLLVSHGNHTDQRGTWEQGYFTTSFPHGQMDTFNVLPQVAFSSELFYALTTSTSVLHIMFTQQIHHCLYYFVLDS